MSGSANGQVLDHYLHPQFEVIRAVYDQLDAIRAVASHLTPVEDLTDFQAEVTALHAKLGLLTQASETIINATPAGIAVLTAVNAAAQRLLLELKSAALYEASHFALASDWAAVELELASLDGRINGVVSSVNQVIATANTDRNNANATVQRVTVLETELTNLETGQTANTNAINTLTSTTTIQGGQIASQGQELTALASRLTSEEGKSAASALALDTLTTTVTQHGAAIKATSSDVTQLASRVTSAETGVAANAAAMSDLTTEVTLLDGRLTVTSEDVVALKAEVGSPGNLAPNAGFEGDTHGWTIFSRGVGWTEAQLGRNEDANTMLPLAMNALSVAVAGLPTGKLGIRSDNLPVRGTQRYLLSGYLAALDCTATLEWRLLDQFGQIIQFDTVGTARIGGTPDINNWPRIWGVIPANTDARTLQIQVWAEGLNTPAPWIDTLATAAAGGTLPAGQYFYRITALVPAGESVVSNEVSITTAGATSANTLTWTAVAGAVGYRIYRGTASMAQDVYYEVGMVTTFTDTGATAMVGGPVPGPAKLWLLRPMLEEISGLQDGPSAWVPGVTGLAKNTAEAVSTLSARVDGVEGDLTATASEVTQLTTEVETVHSALVQEIITSSNKNASFSASINNLSSRMTDAEGDIVASADAVSGLTTRVTNAEGTITSHSQSLTNLQAQVNAIDASTGGSGQAIADLDVRVTAAEGTIDSHSQQITSLQNSVTSANKVFVQNTAPSTTGRTVNDIWIHTGEANKPYFFDGTNWVARPDNSKNKVFYQGTAPTATAVNDLWVNSSDNNKLFRWTGTQWVDISDARTAANASAISSLTSRVTSAEGTITSHSSSITSLQNSVNDPVTGLNASASAINSLTTRVTNTENTNTAQANSISSLNTTVNGNSATISQHASSINGLKAEWNLSLDVNGYVSGIRSQNNGTVAEFVIAADKFKIVKPGFPNIQMFAIDSTGRSNLASDMYLGNGRIVLDTGAYMKVSGIGFGTANQFIEWFGPKMAINLCSEANAITYIKTNGDAYYGGSLSAGILRNSISMSQISVGAEVETGPFGTNGNSKAVVCSLSYTNRGYLTTDPGNAAVSATVVLERSYNGGAWTQIATVSASGNRTSTYDSEFGTYEVTVNCGGSVTYTDNTPGTGSFNYRARITALNGVPMSLSSQTSGQGMGSPGTSRTSIVSTEE